MSGLHRRLLDGSSRQLTVPTANSADDAAHSTDMACEQVAIGIVAPSTISNSTTSLTSSMTPNPSISNQSNNVATSSTISTPLASTFLSSTGGYPMAPSSCLAMRRPSTNTFVITYIQLASIYISSFHFFLLLFFQMTFDSLFLIPSWLQIAQHTLRTLETEFLSYILHAINMKCRLKLCRSPSPSAFPNLTVDRSTCMQSNTLMQ